MQFTSQVRNRLARLACLLVGLYSLWMPHVAGANEYAVEIVKFCSSLNRNKECVSTFSDLAKINRSKLGKRIYSSFRIRCQKNGYLYLEKNGFLPIKIIRYKNGVRIDDIVLNISQENWDQYSSYFKDQIENYGSFSWKFSFYTDITDVNSLEISIAKPNGKKASFIDGSSLAIFRIQIQGD